MTVNRKDSIAEFWRVFQKHEAGLRAASTADHPDYDAVLDQLQQIDRGLYCEFSTDSAPCELIITAEGKASLFPLVEAIVAGAPALPGWTILALKPKLGFPEAVRWESTTVVLSDVFFDPLERKGSADLGLRLFVRGLTPEAAEDAHNALLRALDHGLGERAFAESVQYTEVRPLPSGAPVEEFIPLTDLEDYLRFLRERNG